MSEEDRELALDINALLMAFYTEDLKLLRTIVNDSPQQVNLMLGGIEVLLQIVGELLRLIDENVDELDLDFETLIRIRGEAIAETNFDDD